MTDPEVNFSIGDLESRLETEDFEQVTNRIDADSQSEIDIEVVRADIAALLDEQAPTAPVETTEEVAQDISDQINQVLLVVNMLLILAGFIALLSIAIALSLSVFERTREIGLMRAVGTTRPRLRRTIRWEGAIIAVFGAFIGVVLGLGVGVVSSSRIPEELVTIVAVPWLGIIALVVQAMIAGLISAVFPAWRAGRMNVLEAISHD